MSNAQSPTPGSPQAEAQKQAESETPPFTEAVPNPPKGPEAQERVDKNIDAAVIRGDDKAAEGYVAQTDEAQAADQTNKPAQPATQDADQPLNPRP